MNATKLIQELQDYKAKIDHIIEFIGLLPKTGAHFIFTYAKDVTVDYRCAEIFIYIDTDKLNLVHHYSRPGDWYAKTLRYPIKTEEQQQKFLRRLKSDLKKYKIEFEE